MHRRAKVRPHARPGAPTSALIAAVLCLVANPAAALVWNFANITSSAGFNYQHGYTVTGDDDPHASAGGVAAGDYNRDGYIDLYVVRGDIGPNLLFRNNGNLTFTEVGAAAGVAITGTKGCGPTFGDYDGDGWLDLVIGGIVGTAPRLYRNLGNGTFQNVTATCGISYGFDTYSSTFGDYDRDDDLDIFLTHWGSPQFTWGHLWRNNGNGTFTDQDVAAGFGQFGDDIQEWTYGANFSDMNSDGWPDLLLSSDFKTSEVYMNDGDGTFTNTTNENVITDQYGMGGAVADYDNDLDLDWFVTSVWDTTVPEPGGFRNGNRLYRNTGNGTFQDVTDVAGVRIGFWGWGATFSDFNNDGHLDIYHGSGYRGTYQLDPNRFFVSNGNATFTERSAELGVNYVGQGRGVVAFDAERDGDLDIFVANNRQGPAFFRNNGGNALKWLTIKLRGAAPNSEAIGARIYVTAGGVTQMRELRCGSNYVSQDPAEAHFGMGTAMVADTLRIVWPGGQTDVLHGIGTNHFLTFTQNAITAVASGAPHGAAPAGSLRVAGMAPNPLRSSSTLRLGLAARAPVLMRLFDATGRHVRTLVDEQRAAGWHEVTWDGRDDRGRAVPASTYVYRVEASGEAVSGKIAVVR